MENTRDASFKKFLRFAACPVCKGSFSFNKTSQRLVCSNNAKHAYSKNSFGFYEFAPGKIRDKYDEPEYVREYIRYAYGFRLINTGSKKMFVGTGQSEGLYRVVSEMVYSEYISRAMYEKKEVSILDLACGTGRNIAEIAQRISNCFVIGLDYSSEMIKCAKDIIFGIGNFNLDMGRFGFGKQVMKKYSLSNAFIAQADSANPPISFYKEEGFDFVINRMLIDRITDLERINATLKTSYLALKKGGILVFACPYNWISNETWRHFGSSRLYPLIALQNMGFDVLEAFDGLVYRELYDPHGTFLELPVQVAKLIKT